VLKGEHDEIFHSFKRGRAKWTREAFRNNETNATVWIASVPVALFKNLAMERREPKGILVSVSVDMRTEIFESQKDPSRIPRSTTYQ
jgi:hypothetical protein